MVIKEIARIVLKTKKGKTFEINDNHIVRLSTSASCSSGGGIPAGCCSAGTMSLSFKQQGTGIVEADLFQASLTLYVQYPPYAESVRGVYNVTNSNLRYGIFDVSASDNIGLLDDAAYSAKDTENAVCGLLGIIGSGTMRYPAHILAEICNSYGVPHLTQAENAAIIPESTANLLLTSVSSECSTESIKDFANYLAEYIGGFITAYEDGRVGFGRIGKSEYTETLDEKNIQKGSFQKSPFSVWPTIWKVNFDSGYNNYWYTTSDTPDGYAPLSIEIDNNPFWQYLEDNMPSGLVGGKVSDMIKYMWDYIVSIRNYINPFSATVYVPHLFKLGEIVHIKKPGDDSASREFTSCITDVTWTYRGGQQISCAGSDTRLLSCSASRTSAKKAEDYAKTLYRKKSSGGTGTNDTYTKAEIDSKDAAVKAIADKAQSTATSAATAASNAQSTADSAKSTASSAAAAAADAQNVNKTQGGQITELQKASHTHSNKDILDKIEQPFTTANQTKLNSLKNYTHPTHKANSKGFYKFASDDLGHVSETEAVTKNDIVELGIPGEKTKYYLARGETFTFKNGGNGGTDVIYLLDDKFDPTTRIYDGSRDAARYAADVSQIVNLSGGTYNDKYCLYPVFIAWDKDDATPNWIHPMLEASNKIKIPSTMDGFEVTGKIKAGSFSGANATTEKQGLMSAADKKKLDGIADGANKITVDSALSDTSTNPVQSKAVETALDGKAASDHTHAMITNSAVWIAGANNAAKWYRLGTLVSSGNFSNAVIRVWSGDGANGRANQNASFEIQIKDGWQSTQSATKACGVTVYRINCRSVKVKVIPTAHDTYTVWVYLPWLYWNGNYSVYGKYKSWTSQQLIQSDEPEGTGSDTAYYDQAFLTSTVAKATEATALTETAWTDVPATAADSTSEKDLKYLVMGNTVYVQGYLKFSAGNNNPKCGTLPSSARPNDTLYFTGWDTASGVPTAYPIIVNDVGIIMLMNPTSTAYWFKAGRAYRFNFSFHIN